MVTTVDLDGAQVSLKAMPRIGIAIFPTDGTAAEALLEGADKAMYRAKQGKTGLCPAAIEGIGQAPLQALVEAGQPPYPATSTVRNPERGAYEYAR